uniref:Putative secreted protein n=1 Tax=Anopheles marajoara TaxID=58244 RepID=A0A2M4CF18_9DIPT
MHILHPICSILCVYVCVHTRVKVCEGECCCCCCCCPVVLGSTFIEEAIWDTLQSPECGGFVLVVSLFG